MTRRSGWHQVNGKWTRTLGERGCRVRLFEMTKGGQYYRAVWVPGRGIDRKCLQTSDRAEAERLGRALLVSLMQGTAITPTPQLRLGELWRRYRTDSVAFRTTSARWRAESEGRASTLLAYFGEQYEVRRLRRTINSRMRLPVVAVAFG
jgi:hypothetical protein